MEPFDALPEAWIFSDHLTNAFEAVNDRRMIAASEGGADLDELHAK
jgi:hypothetical protein